MHLAAFDNAVVRNVVWDSGFTVHCPVDVKVLVDNIQIGVFTLEAAVKEVQLDLWGQNELAAIQTHDE